MTIPNRFNATDKLGQSYDYTLVANNGNGFRGIHLFNETTKTDTLVEPEWFNQRRIEELNPA